MFAKINVQRLKSLFSSVELPGWNAQHLFSPAFRDEQLKINAQHQFEAAVGIILFYQNNELSVLFIKRTPDPGPHSGQIAFPGGTKEANETHLETAYREIEEEIGIKKQDLIFIGSLSSLYIPVSKFLVFPFVFFCEHLPDLKLNKAEIDTILTFPVKKFLNADVLSTSTIYYNQKEFQVPCFLVNDIVIWGATSMIWNECLSILKQIVNEQNQFTRTTL